MLRFFRTQPDNGAIMSAIPQKWEDLKGATPPKRQDRFGWQVNTSRLPKPRLRDKKKKGGGGGGKREAGRRVLRSRRDRGKGTCPPRDGRRRKHTLTCPPRRTPHPTAPQPPQLPELCRRLRRGRCSGDSAPPRNQEMTAHTSGAPGRPYGTLLTSGSGSGQRG